MFYNVVVRALGLCLVSCICLAQTVCYQYRMASDPWADSLTAAIGYRVDLCNADPTQCSQSNSGNFTNWVFEMIPGADAVGSNGAPLSSPYIRYQRTTTAGHPAGAGVVDGPYTLGTGVVYQVNPAGCPPDPCDATQGEQIDITGMGGIPASTCNGGCRYNVGGVGLYMPDAGVFAASATGTGESCSEGSSGAGAEDAPSDSGNDCFALNGNLVCGTNTQGQYCGVVNDDYVCVAGGTMTAPDSTSCIGYASGGVACGGSATNPPDNGTPGMPADPLVSVSDGGSGSTNYFPPGTVEGSSEPVPVAGNGPTGGGSGSSGSSSSESCLPGSECAGELPTIGEEGDPTFGEIGAAFVGRVQGSPLLQSVSAVSAAWPAGSCPAWNLEAFGDSYSLSAPMCSIWEDVSPFLSGVMLLVWGWVATRIVLSA